MYWVKYDLNVFMRFTLWAWTALNWPESKPDREHHDPRASAEGFINRLRTPEWTAEDWTFSLSLLNEPRRTGLSLSLFWMNRGGLDFLSLSSEWTAEDWTFSLSSEWTAEDWTFSLSLRCVIRADASSARCLIRSVQSLCKDTQAVYISSSYIYICVCVIMYACVSVSIHRVF